MDSINKILSLVRLSSEDKEIEHHEISSENSRRAFVFCLIALPVSIIHVILFALKLKNASGIEQKWVVSIIGSHLAILVLTSVCSLLLYLVIYRAKKNNMLSKLCTNFVQFAFLVIGGIIASVDQYVTSAITPFFIATMSVSLIFLTRPILSTIYFIGAYAVFFFLISHTQLNKDILISNLVNGITVTAIGLGLSIIIWRSTLTKIKQSRQIIRQNKALFESNAEKDKFFSIIAHDLKSPFNTILGFSNLLVEKASEKDYDGIQQYAEIIKDSSSGAMDLLMNLMEWSQAHTGRMEFRPDYLDVKELVEETESLFSGSLLHKKIKFSMNIPVGTVVFADRNMIHAVLRNLLSNAIKFTRSEGVIELSVLSNQKQCTVSISDNGVGIAQERLDGLFRMDKNTSTLGTEREKGTGLGLLLCKELIEKHEGRIWGESYLGKGSTFHFTIPRVAEAFI